MGNLKSHKLVFSETHLYFFCLLAISLSPLALRWVETAAHIEIFRDSTGQPSDLSENAAGRFSPGVEPSSDVNRAKPAESGRTIGTENG